MGRSVGIHPYAAAVVYVNMSYPSEDWVCFLQDLEGVLTSYYDDLQPAKGWHGREGRILLANDRAEVVVYAYDDLVSVNLVAKDGYDEEDSEDNENWCAEQVEGFKQLLHANFDCIEAPTLVRDDDTDGTSFVLGENKMAWIRVEQHPGLGFDVKLAHTADGLHIDAYGLLEDGSLELEGSILLTFD